MPDAREFNRAVLGLLLADALLIGGWVAGGLATEVSLAGHAFATVGIMTVFRQWQVRRHLIIMGTAALVFGPLAGPVLALAMLPLGRSADALQRARLEPDMPRPDRAERLCAEIDAGRRFRNRAGAPVPFGVIFAGGDLRHQQAALALITRAYAPSLRPALDAALASDLPAVRVQAAAVFAHLRDSFRHRARLLLEGEHGLGSEELRLEAQRVMSSGFVDACTSARLATLWPEPAAVPDILLWCGAGQQPERPFPRATPPRLKRYSCGGLA